MTITVNGKRQKRKPKMLNKKSVINMKIYDFVTKSDGL